VPNLQFLSPADDLSHLTLIDASAVRAFVQSVNDILDSDIADRGLVLALGTGGTISMHSQEDGVRVPSLDFDKILEYTEPQLREKFWIEGFDVFQIDSSQMQYKHIRDLAIVVTYIWRNVTKPLYGFLILHGTDTMSYSAAAMSLMLGQGLPFSIVYTGAQKPIQDAMSDAGTNVRNSLYTLESLYKNNCAEVIIAMGDRAFLATSSDKIEDQKANAFDAPLHKFVSRFNYLEYPVPIADFIKSKRKDVAFRPSIWPGDYSHTLVIKSSLGLRPDTVQAQVNDPHIKAVILYSYGAGAVDEDIVDAIIPRAAEKKIPVFVVSPVNSAPKVLYASTRDLIKKGGVPLYMTLSAALAKIEIALIDFDGDPDKMADFMTHDYVGEIPDEKSQFFE